MPDTPEEVIAELEERLKHMAPVTTMLEEGKSPEEILDSLIGPFSPKILEKNEVSFYCGCSKDRVEKALISVGADSIREMLEDGEPIDVSCSFCGKSYRFELDDLKRILTYQESRGNLTE
jgi:molecular chaperone Hsp33